MPKARRGAAVPGRVVGIGASAGGIDALGRLVTHLPAQTGLAFVVLQHLPAAKTGQLVRSLAGMTKLPVVEVKTSERVRGDTIFVVRERTTAALERGKLVLRYANGRARDGLPIDLLFTSLATALERRAIGVVLSGSARDGTLGLRAIREAGGRTFAQDPSTAQCDEMPRSAIAAGVADTVAPPAQIAGELVGLSLPTGFFRDRPVLERAVAQLAEHIADRPATEPVRAWVPDCGNGEEAYSLAMLLVEAFGSRPVQVFGTDLSERAIETARAGRYPLSIAPHVGAERIARYFQREKDGYRVQYSIRDRCMFAVHDLAADPPMSKMDLVMCRNSITPLPLFHYALNQPGVLVIRHGEAIAGHEALFASVDGGTGIYARKPTVRTHPAISPQPHKLELQRDADQVLLARYAPASVIVDDTLEVIEFRGHTGPFLDRPPGQSRSNLLRIARGRLEVELALAIERARERDAPARKEELVVTFRERVIRFDLEVIPLRPPGERPRYFLIVFEPIPERAHPTSHLRGELAAAKEYVATLVAEHQATSDELAVANEDLQSVNTELQSTNEELRTTEEELRSTNEELETLNAALDARLREANDDVLNALASVEIAVVMVDLEHRVRRFTPRARVVLKLLPGDVGRPITDLNPSMPLPGLDEAITRVIETLVVHEREVTHSDGTAYRMRIRPYRTADQLIAGAVITFVDITTLRAAREHATAIVEAVPTPLVVIDRGLHVRTANQAFRTMFGSAVLGRSLLDLGEWRSATLRDRIAQAFDTGERFDELEVGFVGPGGERMLRLGSRALPGASDPGLLLGISDVTEQRRAENARRIAAAEHDAFLDAVSHELRTPLSAILLWGQALRELPPDDPGRQEAVEAILESAQAEAHLIDDLLELSLSRSGQLTVALEPIDALTVIEPAVAAGRKEAADKQINFEVMLPKSAPVNADPRRLRQIMTSLVGNALKFTPAGGTVSVSGELDGHALELRVRDSGDGIPAEFLPHVFESFSQIDRSTTRSHRGLGIGLALVRHLVVRQGGTIDVASPGRGQGTTFTVRLPLLGSAST